MFVSAHTIVLFSNQNPTLDFVDDDEGEENNNYCLLCMRNIGNMRECCISF